MIRHSKGKNPKKRSPRAEYIEWLDPSGNSGWQDEGENAPALCKTVGWVVDETKEFLVFAAAIADDGSILDTTAVPHAIITKRKRIRID